jgi:hypothetical protein
MQVGHGSHRGAVGGVQRDEGDEEKRERGRRERGRERHGGS